MIAKCSVQGLELDRSVLDSLRQTPLENTRDIFHRHMESSTTTQLGQLFTLTDLPSPSEMSMRIPDMGCTLSVSTSFRGIHAQEFRKVQRKHASTIGSCLNVLSCDGKKVIKVCKRLRPFIRSLTKPAPATRFVMFTAVICSILPHYTVINLSTKPIKDGSMGSLCFNVKEWESSISRTKKLLCVS